MNPCVWKAVTGFSANSDFSDYKEMLIVTALLVLFSQMVLELWMSSENSSSWVTLKLLLFCILSILSAQQIRTTCLPCDRDIGQAQKMVLKWN